jgi:hypothetical protein
MRNWINLVENVLLTEEAYCVEDRDWHERMMADFKMGNLTPEEFETKWHENKRLYLYHGTSLDNLPSIIKTGLAPATKPTGSEPVWLAKDPETSDFYQGGRGNGALLRIRKQDVELDIDMGGNTCASFTPILPQFIEIEQPDGSWQPLVSHD